MQERPQWQDFEDKYPGLHADYESSLNSKLRTRVKKMFSKDQKKELEALIRLGSNGQDTIYPSLKPELINVLKRGEVSAFELALIDEWYKSTQAQASYHGYGILYPPS